MRRSFSNRTALMLLALALPLATARARSFVDTFEDGVNDGDWRLTTSSNPIIKPDGGDPGAYLWQETDQATPTWYSAFENGTENHFLGDYTAHQVTALSADIDIFAGIAAGLRNMTLNISTTFGTGNPIKGVAAYYIGRDISNLPPGWHSYTFRVDSLSPTIPPGWVVTRGNGDPGTDEDWQRLMRDVEAVGFELGTPGYFYPFWIWDIGLDNVRITPANDAAE